MKIIIKIVTLIKNSLSEKYKFYFIGILSYLYNKMYILFNDINFFLNKSEYRESIKKIDLKDKKIFVFLYSTDYNDLQQRPQHLATAFSKREDVIIFFMTKNQTLDNVKGIEKSRKNLYLVNNYNIINLLNNYNLIFIGPSNYNYISYLKNYRKIIYDFPDELDFFPGFSKNIINIYHINLLKRADLVTPSADYLEKIIKDDYSESNTKIILNGVFPDDFILDKNKLNFIPNEIRNMGKNRKIVGFYGGLGEGWMDFDLLKYCIKEKKDYDFIIIGGGNISQIIKKYGFDKYNNIYFLGSKPYLDLKYYAKKFDVAIIPFKINNLTLGVSPVKSFEYMVQGLPFVSTALPECEKYQNVLIGKDYEDFVNKIDEGIKLKGNSQYIQELKNEGSKNTWLSRVDLIINKIYNDN